MMRGWVPPLGNKDHLSQISWKFIYSLSWREFRLLWKKIDVEFLEKKFLENWNIYFYNQSYFFQSHSPENILLSIKWSSKIKSKKNWSEFCIKAYISK